MQNNEQALNKSLSQALAEGMAEKESGEPQPAKLNGHSLHMIEDHLGPLDRVVAKLRDNAAQLEAEIEQRASTLRQTRSLIDAYSLATGRLRP
jgi:type VI protein secretion system component VasF